MLPSITGPASGHRSEDKRPRSRLGREMRRQLGALPASTSCIKPQGQRVARNSWFFAFLAGRGFGERMAARWVMSSRLGGGLGLFLWKAAATAAPLALTASQIGRRASRRVQAAEGVLGCGFLLRAVGCRMGGSWSTQATKQELRCRRLCRLVVATPKSFLMRAISQQTASLPNPSFFIHWV